MTKIYLMENLYPSLEKRIDRLQRLKLIMSQYEQDILTALWEDLHKNAFEAYSSEIALVGEEIKLALKNIKKWMKFKKVRTPFFLMPAKSEIWSVPYGKVLILSPWNYPWQLAMSPLVSALAAGNTAILKPSELSPATSQLIAKLIPLHFDPSEVRVALGDSSVAIDLLSQKHEKIDKIFFTGSPQVGKQVMQMAAQNLTPLTLELGGKSPVMVLADADLDLCAKRIASGKWMNAGQTCVAPDFVLAQEDIIDELINKLKKNIRIFYGENPELSPDYGRIISVRHADRLRKMMEPFQERSLSSDSDPKYIPPTIIKNPPLNSQLMQEEIFGPLLPVISFKDIEEALNIIRSYPKALALYLFTSPQNKARQNFIIQNIPFGGGAIGDTLVQVANPHLPFGGIGPSGLGGAYHSYEGFRCFSHEKSIMRSRNNFITKLMDLSLRYPPFSGLKFHLLKKIL